MKKLFFRKLKWHLYQVGIIRVKYYHKHCDNCGSKLSEWFMVETYDPVTGKAKRRMCCYICGVVSQHEGHPFHIVPFWLKY